MRLPGPPELLPGRPDAMVDLQSADGVALVGGSWRFLPARIEEIDFVDVGPDLGPGDRPNRTHDVVPHGEGIDVDDSTWRHLEPEETRLRLGTGRVCFAWYRIAVTIPDRVGDHDPTGATVVFECVVDDYAEVWVDGRLDLALGRSGGQVVSGFNAPNRVVLTRDARPGQRFQIAVFGMNGPISASPRNYIWMRTASLDFYAAAGAAGVEVVKAGIRKHAEALARIVPEHAVVERVATGFEFTEGPLWSPDGTLLFSSPNTNAIYRWSPVGTVEVFRSKSGYAGADIGRYLQPGSNGLAFDPQGRLVICQHGNRRVLRVNPHGDITVIADRFGGRRLNSPNDLVYGSDGTLYFTDPPFGLPAGADDPARELPFSAVFAVPAAGGVRLVTDELLGPNGIALSPDEAHLYVGNWDPERKVVMRYPLGAGVAEVGPGEVFADLTGEPGEDAIDGIKVDQEGNVYVCGPSGLWIFSPDGHRLGTIEFPESPHNLAWGDDDGRALYVAALSSIYRIRLGVPGAPAPASRPAAAS